MQIQSHLASTIAMAFDECVENPAPYDYVKQSCERTTRWLVRCKTEMDRLNSLPETINKKQMLFGINQGGTYEDLRVAHMERSPSSTSTAMPSAVLPSARRPRRCTVSSMRSSPICRKRSRVI